MSANQRLIGNEFKETDVSKKNDKHTFGKNCDILKKSGWSWGYVSALDCDARTIRIVDAHGDDGKRFVVRADEILTAFLGFAMGLGFSD